MDNYRYLRLKSIAITFFTFTLRATTIESVSNNDDKDFFRTGIVLYPDAMVLRQIGSEFQSSRSSGHVSALPLGSFVLIDKEHPSSGDGFGVRSSNSSSSKEWVHLLLPVQGWLPATVVQIATTESVASFPLWKSLPGLFSAGHGVMATRKLSTSWLDQWPIGTGKIGALVGGNIDEEIIPISIADLFVMNRKQWVEFHKYQTESLISGTNSVGFTAARSALKQGDFKGARKGIARINQSPEGQFEYAADLILCFFHKADNEKIMNINKSERIVVDSSASKGKVSRKGRDRSIDRRLEEEAQNRENSQIINAEHDTNLMLVNDDSNNYSNNYRNNGSDIDSEKNGRRRKLQGKGGERSRIIKEYRSTLVKEFPFKSGDFRSTIGDRETHSVHELSFLDTKNGAATTQHLVESSTSTGFSTAQLHQRRWFASDVDNVIVGKLSCVDPNKSPGSGKAGCLHLGIKLARERGLRDFPAVGVEDRDLSVAPLPTATTDSSSSTSSAIPPSSSTYTYKALYIGPSVQSISPHTYLCLAVRCTKSKNRKDLNIKKADSSFSFTCTGGDEVDILISIEKQDSLDIARDTFHSSFQRETWFNSSKNPFHHSNDVHGMFEGVSKKAKDILSVKCWNNIDTAIALGEDNVFERHTESFSSKTARVVLTTGSTDSGLRSSSSDDELAVPMNPHWNVQAMFFYARYLLLSSSSKSVSNLQGLWADGRSAAWRGDYHININLQMQYWASDAAGLQETFPPLFDFIHRLAKTGEATAKSMYGCDKGWVSHGFTDGFLDGGMASAVHWALCVTCGAWTALALWDHVTYSGDTDVLTQSLLPVFKGISEFFLLYMLTDNGARHTGPTTSPENSYRYQQTVQQLSLSPAIDMSVLRQVATAYSLAIDMIRAHQDSVGYIPGKGLSSLEFEEHSKIAADMLFAVSSMPFGAAPVVGIKTGLILEYPLPYIGAHTDAPPLPKPDGIRNYTGISRDLSRTRLLTEVQHNRILSERLSLSLPETSLPAIGRRNVQDKAAAIVAPVSSAASPEVSEDGDPGHRHFSSMHWLYPGVFLPSDERVSDVEKLYSAARRTLEWKRNSDGGHTSWSSAWEACLWARLGDRNEVWRALKRITSSYTTPRLMSLHPPLQRQGSKGCLTCFGEKRSSRAEKRSSYGDRGMITADNSPFQLDGNMGYLAALCEALLQTHVPGHIVLLPALPKVMAQEGGSVEGLRARGNAIVSVSWRPLKHIKEREGQQTNNASVRTVGGNGYVHVASILFRAPHIWYAVGSDRQGPFQEVRPGFFSFPPPPPSFTDTSGINTPKIPALSNVIIVYPFGKRTLRLFSSHLLSEIEEPRLVSSADANIHREKNRKLKNKTGIKKKSKTFFKTDRNTNSDDKEISVKEGGDRCARVLPDLNIIPSINITVAANPGKYASKEGVNEGRNNLRQGLGIQIYSYPCRIVLRA